MTITTGHLAKAKAAPTGDPAKQAFEDAGNPDHLLLNVFSTFVSTTGAAGFMYYLDPSEDMNLILPASPSAGDIVGVFATDLDYVVTVTRNGSNINGVANDFVVPVPFASFVFQYVDATVGWAIRLHNDHSNDNILINTDLSDAINQRVISSTDALDNGDYSVDRWYVVNNGADDGNMNVDPDTYDGTRFTVTTIGTSQTIADFRQKVEKYAQYAGKPMTVKVLAKVKTGATCSLTYSDGVGESSVSLTADDAYHWSDDLTFTTTGTPTQLLIWTRLSSLTNGDYVEIKAIKLEEGSVSTPWTVPDPEVEAGRCYRYFQRFYSLGNPYFTFGYGSSYSSTDGYSGIYYKPMRAQPTLSSSGNFMVWGDANAIYPVTGSLSCNQYSNNFAFIQFAVASGLTTGGIYALRGNNDATAYIDLNAEL